MQNLTKYDKITVALAGIFQASALVNQLAKTGTCDAAAFDNAIQSLFKIDAPDVPSVFGGMNTLHLGFEEIIKVFSSTKKNKPDQQISRYSLSLVLLFQQLKKHPEKMQLIKSRIIHASTQYKFFHELNSTIFSNLADIYLQSLGAFKFRIQVIGKASFLQNQETMNKVRALLLAGIRATVLWEQVGGVRWQLFISRNKLKNTAQNLLTH